MGRVIDPYAVGKQRNELLRSVVLALRELAHQSKPDVKTRDLVAFLILALQLIWDTIDQSVNAWEKRGYWLKADRFRREWAWTGNYSQKMYKALVAEDWQGVADLAILISEKVQKVKLPQRHQLGTPWVGAWERLQHPE